MSEEEKGIPKISLKLGITDPSGGETPELQSSDGGENKKTSPLPRSPIKLSISDIKTDISEEQNKKQIQDTSPVVAVKKEAPEFQTAKISLSSIVTSNQESDALQATKNQENKEKGERDAALKIQHIEDKKNQKKVFGNYESQFEKESVNFVERIKNFGKRPQTRIGFVIGVIVIGIGLVSALMVLQPEKHSFSIYKANIIYMYHSTLGKSETPFAPSTAREESGKKETPLEIDIPEIEESTEIDASSKEEIKKEKLREYLQNKK